LLNFEQEICLTRRCTFTLNSMGPNYFLIITGVIIGLFRNDTTCILLSVSPVPNENPSCHSACPACLASSGVLGLPGFLWYLLKPCRLIFFSILNFCVVFCLPDVLGRPACLASYGVLRLYGIIRCPIVSFLPGSNRCPRYLGFVLPAWRHLESCLSDATWRPVPAWFPSVSSGVLLACFLPPPAYTVYIIPMIAAITSMWCWWHCLFKVINLKKI
jgi:hypothetical protein